MNSRPELNPSETDVTRHPDEDSWAPLRQRLLRHARMVLHEQALAEDLVQESLLAIFERPDSHKGQASLATWATAILKNKIADWYRSPHQRRRVFQNDEADNEFNPTDGLYDEHGAYNEAVPAWQQPESQEAQRQAMVTLEQCVRRLPPQTGRVFMMREWLGFETPEICERLGLTAENCRTILHRARTGLRQCMSSYGHSARSMP